MHILCQASQRPTHTKGKLAHLIWPQSSQLVEPLWTDPGLKTRISVHELISKKKSTGMECMVEHSPEVLPSEEKATTTTIHVMNLSL